MRVGGDVLFDRLVGIVNYDDTNLDYYLRDQKNDLCLRCTLEICSEESPSCLYQITRSRKGYYEFYYAQNRDRKLKAATERNRQRVKTGEYAEYYREYRRKKKQAIITES